MAKMDDARSYSDRGALRVPSRPIAFNRSDDEAVFLACQQAIQRSNALLLRAPEASIRISPVADVEYSSYDVLRVFYTSSIPKERKLKLKQDDIDNILRISRKENLRQGITGILVANEKMYSQIIEGPSGSIKDLIGRISCDTRHQDIKIISRDIARKRLFPDWSMGLILTDLELGVLNDSISTEDDKEASDILSFCSSMGIETV